MFKPTFARAVRHYLGHKYNENLISVVEQQQIVCSLFAKDHSTINPNVLEIKWWYLLMWLIDDQQAEANPSE